MTASPWWTAADDAELAVLVREFVNGVYEHRERCRICSSDPTFKTWCQPIRDALEVIIEWREGRLMRSVAAGLRARQNLIDLGNEAPGRAANGKEAA